MKICNKPTMRLSRVLRIGIVFGSAVLTAGALQAQSSGPTPAPQQSAPMTGNPAYVSHEAREFLQFAAQANQTEIAMANVAEEKAQSPKVKDLAQMMLTDHQENYQLLQAIAEKHEVKLKATLDWKNQRAVDRLEKVKAADFDRDYTKTMIKDHVHAITRFDKAVSDLKEPFAIEYAQNTLPALRKHLRHSEDAARSVGVSESTISEMLKGLPISEAQRNVAFNHANW